MWQIVPNSDSTCAFISEEEVATKPVKIKVNITPGPDFEYFFTVTVKPGYPTKLAVIDPLDPVISVPNGETIPPITVTCFDNFGNRTGPVGRSKWTVSLSPDGPISGGDFPVLSDGTACLSRMLIDVEDPGLHTHAAELHWCLPGDITLSQETEVISALIMINVLPGCKPEDIEVCNRECNKLSLDGIAMSMSALFDYHALM